MSDRALLPLRDIYYWLFTFFHQALRILRKLRPKSLLDVGCGRGFPVKMLKCYKAGLDIDICSLRACLHFKTHNNVVLADAANLPFHNKSFDAVLCLQVLHLLKKESSLMALKEFERVAKRCVIIGVPVGFIPEGIIDSWKSAWYPSEFLNRGYKVEILGFRRLHRLALRHINTSCSRLIFASDPFINIFGKLLRKRSGHHMICYKLL